MRAVPFPALSPHIAFQSSVLDSLGPDDLGVAGVWFLSRVPPGAEHRGNRFDVLSCSGWIGRPQAGPCRRSLGSFPSIVGTSLPLARDLDAVNAFEGAFRLYRSNEAREQSQWVATLPQPFSFVTFRLVQDHLAERVWEVGDER